jgi:single-strand DNA-binding protein
MNKIILFGRLTRDPEVRVTPSDKTVCTFTLAVDRQFASQNGTKEADFINIVVWGKAAEMCGNSLAKGHRLLVEGRLQIRNYIAKNGEKRYVTEVIANSVKFIERRDSNANSGQEHTASKSGMERFGQAVAFDFDEEIPF